MIVVAYRYLLACGLVALCALPAEAAPQKRRRPVARQEPASGREAPMPGNYVYQVRAGDSVRKLANEYFVRAGDRNAIAAVEQLNHLRAGGHLVAGSTISIPRRYLTMVPARALVSAFRGDVALTGGRPARVNAVLTEGARIQTGANSSISLRLEDDSTITLPSQSAFVLERLRLVLISGELQHVFRLDRGRSQFVVTPAKGPAARFQVRTPVSVSAVRGTEFRVAVENEGTAAIAEVLKDDVEVTGRGGGDLLLNEGFGAKSDAKGVGKAVRLLPTPEVLLPIVHNADGTLTFRVKPVDGAARYRLQVASDIAFQEIVDEVADTKPALSIAKAPEGDYFVKVTAIDPQGIEGLQHIYPFEYHP